MDPYWSIAIATKRAMRWLMIAGGTFAIVAVLGTAAIVVFYFGLLS